MNAQTPIAERIAPRLPRMVPLIGKLGSPHDGEIVAAARAIERQLERHGLAWTDLGRALEGRLVQRIEIERQPDIVLRDWRCAVAWVRSHPHWEPSEREREFIVNMYRILKRHRASEKQAEWIRGIVERLEGELHA